MHKEGKNSSIGNFSWIFLWTRTKIRVSWVIVRNVRREKGWEGGGKMVFVARWLIHGDECANYQTEERQNDVISNWSPPSRSRTISSQSGRHHISRHLMRILFKSRFPGHDVSNWMTLDKRIRHLFLREMQRCESYFSSKPTGDRSIKYLWIC